MRRPKVRSSGSGSGWDHGSAPEAFAAAHTEGKDQMIRKLGVFVASALLAAAVLPATVAAGNGNTNHGGGSNAPITVRCAMELEDPNDPYSAYLYDVVAYLDPDVVTEMHGNGDPIATAWWKASAKTTAYAGWLGELTIFTYQNYVEGRDLRGYGWPYVQVQVGYEYYDYDRQDMVTVILASDTARCVKGEFEFGR